MKSRILIPVLLLLSLAPIKLSAAIDAEKEIAKINEKIDNIYKIVDNIYSMLESTRNIAYLGDTRVTTKNSSGATTNEPGKVKYGRDYNEKMPEKNNLLQEKQNIQKK
jgi:hypothetical protein